MEKISVIIPVYNVEKFLPRCLDSIINSTYQNLEIICVNDGSTDGSLKVLKDYAQRDGRIVIIDKENGGVSSTRNIGLEKACGEYIAFIDSDDWVHREYFELLYRGINEQNADISICGYAKMYENDELSDSGTYLENAFALQNINPLNPPHMLRSFVWGRLYKKSVWGDRRFSKEISFMEDKELSLSIIAENKNLKVAEINAPLYYYFIREDSLTGTVNIPKTLLSLNHLLKHADIYNDDREKAVYICEVMRYSLIILGRAKEQRETDEQILAAIKLVKETYQKMQNNKMVGFKYKLVYGVFSAMPCLHHLLRKLKYSNEK